MTTSPLIAIGRAKLHIAAGEWSAAAAAMLGPLASEPADSPLLAECLALLRSESDALVEAVGRLALERGAGEAVTAMLGEILWDRGFAAHGAGQPARSLALLGLCRELLPLEGQAEYRLLRTLVGDAAAVRDFDQRRAYLGAVLALDRLPIQDRLPSLSSLEIDTTTQSAEDAAAILSARGAVVLRRLFDTSLYAPLVAAFEEANPNETIAVRIGGTPIMEQARGLVPPFLTELMRHLMGQEPVLLPHYCFMRGLKLGQHRMVPFHQDMNNFETEMVNCWVPLTPCLDTAPRLEVVAERLHELIETRMDTGDFKWIEESLVRQRFAAGSIVAPAMDVGDAIVILPSTVHRSFATDDTVEKRFSLELRFGTR